MVAILTISIAQLIKLPINYLINQEWTPSIVLSTGGMPSSHSAFVTSLMISMGIDQGISSPYFAIATVLALVVIHDAMGIRREAGKHATVLNEMAEDIEVLFKSLTTNEVNKETYNKKLKELLGHEPSEAIAGVALGVLVTVITYGIYIL